MNVLVTGVQTIKGRFVCGKLSEEHTVYGLDNVLTPVEGVKRIFLPTEFDEIKDIDAVIHLAGMGFDTTDFSKSLEFIESNLGLTQCIYEWFKSSTATQFYFLSSIKAVGKRDECEVLTEKLPPAPFGPLGESKYLAEQYILQNEAYLKKTYILRTALLHGKGRFFNYNVKRVFRILRKGLPFPFGSFECRRSFTSLDNFVFVLMKMLEKPQDNLIPSDIYNVCDDGSLSSNEFYKLLGEATGNKIRILYLGKRFFKCIADFSEKFKLSTFNMYEYDKLNTNFIVSNQKIKDALGIEKMPFPLKDRIIKSTLEYMALTSGAGSASVSASGKSRGGDLIEG